MADLGNFVPEVDAAGLTSPDKNPPGEKKEALPYTEAQMKLKASISFKNFTEDYREARCQCMVLISGIKMSELWEPFMGSLMMDALNVFMTFEKDVDSDHTGSVELELADSDSALVAAESFLGPRPEVTCRVMTREIYKAYHEEEGKKKSLRLNAPERPERETGRKGDSGVILLGNLEPTVTEEQLITLFKIEDIENIIIAKSSDFSRKGHAYVILKHHNINSSELVREANGKVINGQEIVASRMKDEPKGITIKGQVRSKIMSLIPRQSGDLQFVLKSIVDYPHQIPVKQEKFCKFVVNSMNVKDESLATYAWETIGELLKEELQNVINGVSPAGFGDALPDSETTRMKGGPKGQMKGAHTPASRGRGGAGGPGVRGGGARGGRGGISDRGASRGGARGGRGVTGRGGGDRGGMRGATGRGRGEGRGGGREFGRGGGYGMGSARGASGFGGSRGGSRMGMEHDMYQGSQGGGRAMGYGTGAGSATRGRGSAMGRGASLGMRGASAGMRGSSAGMRGASAGMRGSSAGMRGAQRNGSSVASLLNRLYSQAGYEEEYANSVEPASYQTTKNSYADFTDDSYDYSAGYTDYAAEYGNEYADTYGEEYTEENWNTGLYTNEQTLGDATGYGATRKRPYGAYAAENSYQSEQKKLRYFY